MIQTPTTYIVPSERTSPLVGHAFACGCGGPVSSDETLRPGYAALFGSPARWSLITRALRERRLIYADNGYFGRRQFFRITLNAYQHNGRGTADPSRFQTFNRPLQLWRRTGSHVLVCPQSAAYFGLFGMNVQQWIADVVSELRQYTDRPIRIRWKRNATPISGDLHDCWAVVAYSSISAIDALIAGVPVFVKAEFASAFRMGTPDLARIEDPVYPDDREAFCAVLAANQWTIKDIVNGVAWRRLRQQEVAHAA